MLYVYNIAAIIMYNMVCTYNVYYTYMYNSYMYIYSNMFYFYCILLIQYFIVFKMFVAWYYLYSFGKSHAKNIGYMVRKKRNSRLEINCQAIHALLLLCIWFPWKPSRGPCKSATDQSWFAEPFEMRCKLDGQRKCCK